LDLLSKVRTEITTDESKKELAKKSQEIFEGAMETSFDLFELTNDDKYLEEAFLISERNKALSLLDKLNDTSAKSFAAIPDSLLQLERSLSAQLNKAKKIFVESADVSNNKKESSIQIDSLSIQLDKLLHKLEREYPKYHTLKYGSDNISLSDIRKNKVKGSTAVLEYFVGEENIFAFALTKSNILGQRIPLTSSVSSAIDTLSTLISRIPASKEFNKEYKSIVHNSSTLYDAMIRPFIASFDEKIKSLVIVADKKLNSFPFAILIKTVGQKSSFGIDNHQYLFEDFTISNQYSLEHWSKIKSGTNNYRSSFSGFAPSFQNNSINSTRSCDNTDLQDLKCNGEEIQAVSNHLKGSYLENADATLKNFLSRIDNSKIIHLATHTCLDTANTGLSRIYLTDGEISMFDLNTYEMNSELAVLSACNTGIGEYVSGDGIQSLAWSFMQAGCKSTLMSLWSIDDCTTANFMDYYYKNLKDGKKKDVALQNAKIEFLSNAPKTQRHPFYWAAFTTYGSMDSIQSESNFLIYMVGSFVLISLLFFGLYKSRKSPQNKKGHLQ